MICSIYLILEFQEEYESNKAFQSQYWLVSGQKDKPNMVHEYGKIKERCRQKDGPKYERERGRAKQTFLTQCLSNLIKVFVRCCSEHLEVKA